MRSACTKDGRDRHHQNPKVKQEGRPLDILEVYRDHFFKCGRASPGHLPRPRDARLHSEPTQMIRPIVIDLVRDWGAGADQAHVSTERIPELWELVEARLA